jgi:hypothetical protein
VTLIYERRHPRRKKCVVGLLYSLILHLPIGLQITKGVLEMEQKIKTGLNEELAWTEFNLLTILSLQANRFTGKF